MEEKIAAGSSVVVNVDGTYMVLKTDANGRLEIIPFGPPVGTQDVNLIEVLGAAIAPGNPNIVGVFDAAGNRMPAMDVAARPGFVDPIDRWARLLGQIDLARYLGAACGPLNPIDVQDTGLNTNPERYRQDNHWDSGVEIVLVAAAAVNLGAAVGAGVTRRIREITVRNAAQANTVVTLSDAGGDRLSFDVPAQSTRTWSSQDGREFLAGVQPQIESSAAGAAPAQTFITASGVEA